jgi:ribose 5-phosphate isomerase B
MSVIAVGADHAGYSLKEDLRRWLAGRGHTVLDFGTHTLESVDYPDFAVPVAEAVATGTAERGVLVCGSGTGMAMAANKVDGIRAALCYDVDMARLSREHNDANVLTLGARTNDGARAIEILTTWLGTSFAGGRHARRVEKLMAVEHGHAPAR